MLKSAGLAALIALLVSGTPNTSAPSSLASRPLHEASFYHKLDGNKVACDLCPRRCVLAHGQRGVCRVRESRDGKLYSVVYGRPCSVGKEPIEKAPFFHFLPGKQRITIATPGCNQRCKYCQNWEFSQANPEDLEPYDLEPADVVALALREQVPIICFTYTEPVVFFEYMADIARLARPAGIKTAVVTGGYVNPAPLETLCRLVDAVKIDLKGFTPRFYEEVCGSTLDPVLEACRIVARSPAHLEIVNLVVPTLNDDTATIRRMCRWMRENLGDTVPVHFTRFSPAYRLQNSAPTPVSTIERAIAIARGEGLKYVYIGNVPGHQYESTRCPNCGRLLVERRGYTVGRNDIKDRKCPNCGSHIPGVWS